MMALLMGIKTVSPKDLLRQVQAREVTVVDVNDVARWRSAHVPGAINLDPLDYASTALPADTAAQLVFYCSNPLCRKAPQAARRALAMGYGNVCVMSAGINGWLAASLPIERGT